MTLKSMCFSHGQESGPWGTQIRAMAARARRAGGSCASREYRGLEERRVRAAQLGLPHFRIRVTPLPHRH